MFDNTNDHSYKSAFEPLSSVTGLLNHGFSLNGSFWWATSKEVAHSNCLVIGPTGSGKSAVICTPNIFSLARGRSSMCILDVSGELHTRTSGWLKKKGYNVYCIDFTETSDSFNPLLLCRTLTDVQKIAFLLIKNSGLENKNDPYWTASAEMMLAIFIEYLVFHAHKDHCTMWNLVRMCDMYAAEPKKIDLLIIRTSNTDLITRYRAMNNVSEKTRLSTLSTVRVAMRVFGTPALRLCTATSSIDFESFRKQPSVLYISIPLNDVAYYASYSALIFEALFKQVMSRIPEKSELSIFCIIDELATLTFENPGLIWSNCRKYKAGCLGLIQHEKMLEMCCSPVQSQAIKANSNVRIFLPGQDQISCKNLETALGRYTYVDDKGIERTRFLMSISELHTCQDAIILCSGKAPIRAKLRPFYESLILRRRTSLPPYIRSDISVSEPPLLPFE